MSCYSGIDQEVLPARLQHVAIDRLKLAWSWGAPTDPRIGWDHAPQDMKVRREPFHARSTRGGRSLRSIRHAPSQVSGQPGRCVPGLAALEARTDRCRLRATSC